MRELILNNFWLKVLSVILATYFWYVLNTNLQSEAPIPRNPFSNTNLQSALQTPVNTTKAREFKCPVTLLVSPADRGQYKLEPSEVTVKIYGETRIVDSVDSKDIRAYVNLWHQPEWALRVEAIVPHDVSLRSVTPAYISAKPSTP